jgi:uncharacterized repeat protein (TIGR03847 family)
MEITPEVFTADYEGEPGNRTFFIQSRSSGATLSFLVEKQQVAILAERLRELLLLVDTEDPIRNETPKRSDELSIVTPVEPEWRVGAMALTYDEAEDRMAVFLGRLGEGEGEQPPEDLDDFDVRFGISRDQARDFVIHAVAVVDEGRAVCQLCGLPMSPEGHECPAANGHQTRA